MCDLESDLNAWTCALQLTPFFSHGPLKRGQRAGHRFTLIFIEHFSCFFLNFFFKTFFDSIFQCFLHFLFSFFLLLLLFLCFFLPVFNLLISRAAHVCSTKKKTRYLMRTSHKKFRLFSILHSSEFCFVIFKTGVPHCSVGSCSRQIHCKTFTESQPPRTLRKLRRIEHCCDFARIQLIRKYAQLHDLVIDEIFDHTH